jgi:hypothetical protein
MAFWCTIGDAAVEEALGWFLHAGEQMKSEPQHKNRGREHLAVEFTEEGRSVVVWHGVAALRCSASQMKHENLNGFEG